LDASFKDLMQWVHQTAVMAASSQNQAEAVLLLLLD
jgi:hypothetical protein